MVGAFNYSMESIEDSLKQAALAGVSGGWMTGVSMRPAGVLMLCINRMIVGSPQLQVFLPSLWESQLTAVCQDVCARVHVNNSTKIVTLPKVFETHRDLFPKDHQDFLVAISMYCPTDVRAHRLAALCFCNTLARYSVHWSATRRSRLSITAKTGGWFSPVIHSRRGAVPLLRGSLFWAGRSMRRLPRCHTQPSPSFCPPLEQATIVFLPHSRSSTLLNTEETFNFICRLRRFWRHRT